MNILSIYFSGTNNTKFISNALKEKCSEDNKFDEINVGKTKLDTQNIVFEHYDLFILGGPVYVESYPIIFTNFIKSNLKNIKNKKIIIYQTAASDNPPAIYELYKFFKDKNNIVSMASFSMTNNFYMNGMFKYTEDEQREVLMLKCNEKINEISSVINNTKDIYIDATLNKYRYILGNSMYKILNKTYLSKYAYKNFSSNSSCTGCGICKIECPVLNIEVNKSTKSITYSKKCIGCMRCIHICPNNAILFNKSKIRTMNMLK